jgi:hypothetical protein
MEKEIRMNFLEQLLRIAPDGGNGSLELLLFLLPLAGIVIRRVWHDRKREA